MLWFLSITIHIINVLWVPGHIGLQSNEYANPLANSTQLHISLGFTSYPFTDIIPILHKAIFKQ